VTLLLKDRYDTIFLLQSDLILFATHFLIKTRAYACRVFVVLSVGKLI